MFRLPTPNHLSPVTTKPRTVYSFYWLLAVTLANKILAFWGPNMGGFFPPPIPPHFKKMSVCLISVDFPAIFKFNQIGFHYRKYLPILSLSLPHCSPWCGSGGFGLRRPAVKLKQYITWSQACKMRTHFSFQINLGAPKWKNSALRA